MLSIFEYQAPNSLLALLTRMRKSFAMPHVYASEKHEMEFGSPHHL